LIEYFIENPSSQCTYFEEIEVDDIKPLQRQNITLQTKPQPQ